MSRIYMALSLFLHNFYISQEYPVRNFINRRWHMKFLKIILGLAAASALLTGGFTAGTFITQTRAASFPA